MPASRYFTVTQEREIQVVAPDTLKAAQVAQAVFNGDSPAEAVIFDSDGVTIARATDKIKELRLAVEAMDL